MPHYAAFSHVEYFTQQVLLAPVTFVQVHSVLGPDWDCQQIMSVIEVFS